MDKNCRLDDLFDSEIGEIIWNGVWDQPLDEENIRRVEELKMLIQKGRVEG